jgi:hypothetical protein
VSKFVSLLVIVCFASVASVSAATLTLKTGNAPVGSLDPLFTVRGAECTISGLHANAAPAALQQATVIPKCSSWNPPLTGSSWISIVNGNQDNTPSGGYLFETSFYLPSVYGSPILSFTALSDDHLAAYLNGNLIGQTPASESYYNFWRTTVFSTSNASFFQAGQNVLQMYVINDNLQTWTVSPMGLDYIGQVSYVPEPSALLSLLFGASGLGLGAVIRRR